MLYKTNTKYSILKPRQNQFTAQGAERLALNQFTAQATERPTMNQFTTQATERPALNQFTVQGAERPALNEISWNYQVPRTFEQLFPIELLDWLKYINFALYTSMTFKAIFL